jgi:hypothetical protein
VTLISAQTEVFDLERLRFADAVTSGETALRLVEERGRLLPQTIPHPLHEAAKDGPPTIVAARFVGTQILIDAPKHEVNIFHVETALGSEYIPVQQTFVERYGIRSFVGMGGLLPSGKYFAVILFARVAISRDVAQLFRTLAQSVKLAFLPFSYDEVFSEYSV